MSDKIEYSRMLVKRTDQTGVVPTVPPITATTLNQMIPTDLFVGEFFLNEIDDLLWIRTENGILPISLSGSTGTTTTPTLTQVLFQGNVTNGYNIDVSAGDTIVFGGLSSGSTTDILGLDASGNTIVTTISGLSGDYLPLSGGTVTGDTYFGATSGITMDQTNTRIGLGTATPETPLDIREGQGRLTFTGSTGGYLEISGSTDLPRFQSTIPPYLTKPVASVSLGMRSWDNATRPGYGKVGDAHLYASNEANGLNIINRQGTGTTEDYIRLYAGQDANGTMPDIHIQGSGSTRGFVGIANDNPTEQLDVRGNVKMSGDLTIGLLGSSTPVTNLAVDINGLVVSGSPTADVLWTSGSTVGSRTSTNSNNNNLAQYSLVSGRNLTVGTGATYSAVFGNLNYVYGIGSVVGGVAHAYILADDCAVFGRGNLVEATGTGSGVFGLSNEIRGSYSLVSGFDNIIETGSTHSSIIGGTGNTLNANGSVILGGYDITGTSANMVFVPNLTIVSATTGTSIATLGIDNTGKVITTTSGGGGGSSTITGVTLSYTGWTFNGTSGYWEYDYTNVGITASKQVNFTPYNSSVAEVITSGIYPYIELDYGTNTATITADYQPSADITGQIVIY